MQFKITGKVKRTISFTVEELREIDATCNSFADAESIGNQILSNFKETEDVPEGATVDVTYNIINISVTEAEQSKTFVPKLSIEQPKIKVDLSPQPFTFQSHIIEEEYKNDEDEEEYENDEDEEYDEENDDENSEEYSDDLIYNNEDNKEKFEIEKPNNYQSENKFDTMLKNTGLPPRNGTTLATAYVPPIINEDGVKFIPKVAIR